MSAAMPDVAAAPVEPAAGRSPLSSVSAATRGPFVLKAAALVGLYYGSAKLGYAFNFAGPVAAIIWLPVGVAIAFLSVFGLAFWPAVLLASRRELPSPLRGLFAGAAVILADVALMSQSRGSRKSKYCAAHI